MKCHYEVLDVPKDADEAQIKTAYRKLALKWHPDKNLDNPEEAKVEFQFVQQAYDILSDRQERAWYDKHREQILHGSNSEYDSNLNIFQYFTSSCFKGYGDDEYGFYSVYRKAFEEIVQDDIQYMMDKEELLEVPSFGTSSSSYEEVVGPFYDYWMSYNTKKSFAWLNQYNIQDVRDRRVLKLIDKEHKKARQKAKKECNEEVRALVAFIRKRDKRVKEYSKIREAKILENRQKNEELSKQKRLERQRLLNESHNSEADWTKFDNVKNELEQIEKNLAKEFGDEVSEVDSADEVEEENLYCLACNKIFKSPKAFENHELSKKHKENVALLKEIINDSENEHIDSSEEPIVDDTISLEELSDSSIEKQDKQKRKQKKNKCLTRESISEDESIITCGEKEDFKFETSKKKNKNRRSKTIELESNQTLNIASAEPFDAAILEEAATCNAGTSGKIQLTKSIKKSPNSNKMKENSEECSVDNHCVTCKATFPSKNKLFNHLKKTGHSVHIPQQTQSTKSLKRK